MIHTIESFAHALRNIGHSSQLNCILPLLRTHYAFTFTSENCQSLTSYRCMFTGI